MNREKIAKIVEELDAAQEPDRYFAVLLNNYPTSVNVRHGMYFLQNYQCDHLKKFVEGHDFKFDGMKVDEEQLSFFSPPDQYEALPLKQINWEKVMKNGGYGLEFEFRHNEVCEWGRGKLHGFDPGDSRAFFVDMGYDTDWYQECRLLEDVSYPDVEWYDQ